MQTSAIIIFIILEAIGVFVILQLWVMKRTKSLLGRIIWSFVLLIPFFGLLCYIFLNSSPDPHGESLPEYPPDTGR